MPKKRGCDWCAKTLNTTTATVFTSTSASTLKKLDNAQLWPQTQTAQSYEELQKLLRSPRPHIATQWACPGTSWDLKFVGLITHFGKNYWGLRLSPHMTGGKRLSPHLLQWCSMRNGTLRPPKDRRSLASDLTVKTQETLGSSKHDRHPAAAARSPEKRAEAPAVCRRDPWPLRKARGGGGRVGGRSGG